MTSYWSKSIKTLTLMKLLREFVCSRRFLSRPWCSVHLQPVWWKTSRRFHVSVSIKSSVFFRSTPKCFCWKEWSGASSNLWREHFFYQFLLECLCWARLTEPVISSPQRHRPVSVHAVRPCKYSVKSVLMQPPAFLMKAQVDLRQWETGKIDPRSNFWLCAAPECRWASFNI